MKNIDRFAVTEAQLRALVAEGLKDGGDWCDLYFEDTVYNDFLLRDSEVNSAGYHVDYGCGIRVLKGEKTGYAYSESTAFPDLLRAARTAASIASVTSAGETRPFRSCGSTAMPGVNHYPVLLDWNSADCGEFAPFLKRIEAGIRSRESRTLKVIGMLSWSMSEILMYNSLGELTSDSRPLGSISVQVIFRQGERIETTNVSRSLRAGAEMICDEVAEDLISRAVRNVDQLFEARRPKGGQMPVVMGAGASGILLLEAMGHAFEGVFIRKGLSVFAG